MSYDHLSVVVCSPEDQRTDEDLQEKKKGEVSYEEVLLLQKGGGGGVKMEALVAMVTRMFVKYWIYVCGTMFFFVSFEGKIVLYKVIYMVMFLCCVALYQVILQELCVLLLHESDLEFLKPGTVIGCTLNLIVQSYLCLSCVGGWGYCLVWITDWMFGMTRPLIVLVLM